jgi:competence protein ComEC
MAGILLQWYISFTLSFIIIAALCFISTVSLFRLFPIGARFKLQPLQGISINLLLLSFGLFITWQKDIRHNKNWFGHSYQENDRLIVRIDEPIVEKERSYKVSGYVEAIVQDDSVIPCKGKLLLYFSKDSSAQRLRYGDKLCIDKPLQPIKNTRNPGCFNYEQYAAFQQIFCSVFLKEKDWTLLPDRNVNPFKQFIFSTRQDILSVIREKLTTNKEVTGIAEALLIGYTSDLDRDTVQAYSNTGVVHIIAVSGMSLGLLYLLLLWIFNRIPFVKRSIFVKAIAIISCLWLFALLTGASASALRSAIVFTCIIVGKSFNKNTPVYNSLAASAFVLLCCDPYFLWDIGFQLSYLAVLGIVIFQKHIYHLFYIKNKWLDKLWAMMALTIAAQVLTFPLCIYYFHQFPVLFLFTSMVAIPLATLILFIEISLIIFWWLPYIGNYLGKIVFYLTWTMNKFIVAMNSLPFVVIGNMSASVFSTILLYIIIIAIAFWLMHKSKKALYLSMITTLIFVLLVFYNNWTTIHQKEIIVYNIPQHSSTYFIDGSNYQVIADSALLADTSLQNLHLKPASVLLRLTKKVDVLPGIFRSANFYQFGNKRIMLVNKPLDLQPGQQKMDVDIIIISQSPKLSIAQLAGIFNCKEYVFDASNSLWKIDKWKKDCDELLLHYYSVPDKGAFVFDVNRGANTNY